MSGVAPHKWTDACALQIDRELYTADAADESARFANQRLRQHQLAALCRERGWTFRLMGGFDGSNAPQKSLPVYSLEVVFDVNLPDGLATMTEAGIYTHVMSGTMRFTRGGSPVALAKVPSLPTLSPNIAPTAAATITTPTSNNKRAKSPAGSDDSDDMPLAKRFSSTVDVKPDAHIKDKHKEHNDKKEHKHKDKHRDKQEQKGNVHKDIKKEEAVKSKEEKKKVEKTPVKTEIDSDDEPLSNRWAF